MTSEPFVCEKCGQRGDERPGFRRLAFPEAVGFADGSDMTPVVHIECLNCKARYLFPLGSLNVRMPEPRPE